MAPVMASTVDEKEIGLIVSLVRPSKAGSDISYLPQDRAQAGRTWILIVHIKGVRRVFDDVLGKSKPECVGSATNDAIVKSSEPGSLGSASCVVAAGMTHQSSVTTFSKVL